MQSPFSATSWNQASQKGNSQAPTYACLERMPTQALQFAFYCLIVGEQRDEGKEKIQPHSNHTADFLSHWAPKVTHCQGFLLLASRIFPCLLHNHTEHQMYSSALGCHTSKMPHVRNATAWMQDLTTYTALCFCLPQHEQKIAPPARKRLRGNGHLY